MNISRFFTEKAFDYARIYANVNICVHHNPDSINGNDMAHSKQSKYDFRENLTSLVVAVSPSLFIDNNRCV